MEMLNKKAHEIVDFGPMYSTIFNTMPFKSQYDIVLQRIEGIENDECMEDDEKLADRLLRLILFNKSPEFNIEDCLNYHYEFYRGDKTKFLNFTEPQLTHKPYSDDQSPLATENIVKRIIEWCNKKRNLLSTETKKTGPASVKKEKKLIHNLEDAAENNEALNQMFKLLEDANLIDSGTKIFKDQRSGNKGHFYSTVFLFFEKGYLKRKPTQAEFVNICKNTFKVDISESTARNNNARVNSTINIPPFTQNL